MIVEAHTVGQDDWTTLPDKNGHTTDDGRLRRATSTGTRSHPFLDPLPDNINGGRD